VPLGGKLAGGLSIVIWIAVIFLGRWVGFTMGGDAPAEVEIDLDDLFK
jgi:hypothetical protein